MMFPAHNTTMDFPDHYVSFNFGDIGTYGDVTTALVIGQMQRFYILNGNHTEQYKKFTTFAEKIEYFLKNIALKNKYSNDYDPADAKKVIEEYAAWLVKHPPR